MMQENKELLLKDLCARLPYGVKVEHLLHSPNNPSKLFGIDVDKQVLYCDHKGREEWYKVDFIKPYLRPMSSMTEEEEKEFLDYIGLDPGTDSIENGYIHIIEVSIIYFDLPYKAIDWLNKNMFDYRGLIPQNLAIEITEENNPYKN